MKILSVLSTATALLSCCASGWRVRFFEGDIFAGKSIEYSGKTKIGTSGCMNLTYYDDKGNTGKLRGVKSEWFSDEYHDNDKVYCSLWWYGTEKCEPQRDDIYSARYAATDSYNYDSYLLIPKGSSYMVQCYPESVERGSEPGKHKGFSKTPKLKVFHTLTTGCGSWGGECEEECEKLGGKFHEMSKDGCFNVLGFGAKKCVCRRRPAKWMLKKLARRRTKW
jgi:hypothetical protein